MQKFGLITELSNFKELNNFFQTGGDIEELIVK